MGETDIFHKPRSGKTIIFVADKVKLSSDEITRETIIYHIR